MQHRLSFVLILLTLLRCFALDAKPGGNYHGREIEQGMFAYPVNGFELTINMHEPTFDLFIPDGSPLNVYDVILDRHDSMAEQSFVDDISFALEQDDTRIESSSVSSWEGTSGLFDRFEHHDTENINYEPTQANQPEKYLDPDLDIGHPLFGFKRIWPLRAALDAASRLWEVELEYWPDKSCNAAKQRYDARLKAYKIKHFNPREFTTHTYRLPDDIKLLLVKQNVDKELFYRGAYNPLQHQLHKEFIDILKGVSKLIKHKGYKKELDSSTNSLAGITVTGAQFNKIGNIITAASIADFCWHLLDCGQAVLEGMAAGTIDVARYAKNNPHELLMFALAPEAMSGYYLLRLGYNFGAAAKGFYDINGKTK